MKFKLLALGSLMLCLTSCFDMTETFNIKEDGSGTYELKMDMSRAYAMLAMMKQGAKEEGQVSKKMDSIIYYKSVVDTAKDLTAQEKALLQNAYAKIHMNEDEGEMLMNMYFPFANGKELAQIQKIITGKSNTSIMESFSKALKGEAGNMNGMPANAMGSDKTDRKSGLPISDFTYQLSQNNFSRQVKAVTQAEQTKSETEEMPEQFKELMKINYTTIINLPRAAKKLNGKGTLSTDKKQVTFAKSMDLDAKFTAADFDFSIDY